MVYTLVTHQLESTKKRHSNMPSLALPQNPSSDLQQPSSSSESPSVSYEFRRFARKILRRAMKIIGKKESLQRNPIEFFRPNIEANGELKAHLDETRRDRCLCSGLDEAIKLPYYWGYIDKHEASQVLEDLGHGSFLLRQSGHVDFKFTVSFRCADSTVHARITKYKGQYCFKLADSRQFYSTSLAEFLEHFNKLERFLFDEPYLSKPVNRKRVFTLKEMCTAVIASKITLNTLEKLSLPSHNITEITQILER
ncbi:unnamed protein product [Bursaphelenchus okinawaensis]|uniref:SH2 domain-containing protein n=1 Tax=Bursaphelenchus okinawaensis TaxID=465554 RepID=A0A811LH34_9BILA|nr:unnamed protein product [Bursaphelenchus okinawaensis]CAG9122260.1 unnamed protein product [Bursaphelenchus okinawaensis]